jgi:predicted ABC-type ATPase
MDTVSNQSFSLISEPKLIDFSDVEPSLFVGSRELIDHALASSQKQDEPLLIHLCGIPGSGKSTYARQFLNQNPHYTLVQFDHVMESLPGYQSDKKQLGIVEAFSKWELPARAIGYHLLQALVENSRNIFFDHSAAFIAHVNLINKLKAKGYGIQMHYLPCDPNIALNRVQEREKVIQRHTPEKLIWEREALLKELIPQYRLLVDSFTEILCSKDSK